MTFPEDLTARILEDRRELGIRRAAERLGADPRRLLDSTTMRTAAAAINPAEVQDYDAAVADIVRLAIESDPRHFGIAPQEPQPAPQAAQPAPLPPADGPRQWTDDDVRTASNAEMMAAMDAGLLTGLGIGPSRRRR